MKESVRESLLNNLLEMVHVTTMLYYKTSQSTLDQP